MEYVTKEYSTQNTHNKGGNIEGAFIWYIISSVGLTIGLGIIGRMA